MDIYFNVGDRVGIWHDGLFYALGTIVRIVPHKRKMSDFLIEYQKGGTEWCSVGEITLFEGFSHRQRKLKKLEKSLEKLAK